jgi:hypothetical protein
MLISIGCLFYFIPKKLGFPIISKILLITYIFLVILSVFYVVFEDQLFTKSDAKELVEEQQINLTDEFVLLKNESFSGIGEYYHTFSIKISVKDKRNAIFKIKSSKNFNSKKSDIDSLLSFSNKRYFGPTLYRNYETESDYVREYFKPSRKEGYAPIFRKISIKKIKNELKFEDFDD